MPTEGDAEWATDAITKATKRLIAKGRDSRFLNGLHVENTCQITEGACYQPKDNHPFQSGKNSELLQKRIVVSKIDDDNNKHCNDADGKRADYIVAGKEIKSLHVYFAWAAGAAAISVSLLHLIIAAADPWHGFTHSTACLSNSTLL